MGNEAILGKPLLVRLGSALPLWGVLDLHCHSRIWDKCFHISSRICWSNENHKRFIPQVMFSFRPSLTNARPDTFLWLIWLFLKPNLLCVLLIKTTAHQKAPWTHTQVRSVNSILTWPCRAFSKPHLFPFPSFLLLLSHPVVPIMFCHSFQKCVWNGPLFASSKKSKEIQKKYTTIVIFWLFNTWLWFYSLTSSFLGKGEKKSEHGYVPSTHQQSTSKVQSAASFWLFLSPLSVLDDLTLLVSRLLLVQVCFYILISHRLLFSCALCTGYYVLSTTSQPNEKNNAMQQQWASK